MEKDKKKKVKDAMTITNSFKLLTTGIQLCSRKTQRPKDHILEEEKPYNNVAVKNLIFPDLSKEKQEIEKVKQNISNLLRNKKINSNLSQEKKENKISKEKMHLQELKDKLYSQLQLTSSNIDEVDPLVTFEEIKMKCKLPQYFIDNIIKGYYKFDFPSPIQSTVIPLLMKGKNLVASSETGSGKTLAYLIPIIHSLLSASTSDEQLNKVLIFLPTKELSKQIYNETLIYLSLCEGQDKAKLKVKYVNKGMIESIKGNYSQFLTNNNIFIATPKNINNLLDICKDDLINKVKYIVLDEADKFFDYGFAELVSEILDKFKDKYSVTKCFFSATILESLGELITTQFFDSIKISIGLSNIPARHIEQEFIYCTNEEGKLIGIRNLFKGKIEFPILIFVEGIKKLNSIYECIKYEIQNISLIHSKMSKQEREKQITKFRLGETWVLICSDLLARGVDFKNVKTVINYDCPYRPVNYIHRIGRTGRAGKTGKAITFVIDDDVNKLKSISRMINNMIKETPGIVKCPQWLIKLSQKNSENKNGDKEENMKENK